MCKRGKERSRDDSLSYGNDRGDYGANYTVTSGGGTTVNEEREIVVKNVREEMGHMRILQKGEKESDEGRIIVIKKE